MKYYYINFFNDKSLNIVFQSFSSFYPVQESQEDGRSSCILNSVKKKNCIPAY